MLSLSLSCDRSESEKHKKHKQVCLFYSASLHQNPGGLFFHRNFFLYVLVFFVAHRVFFFQVSCFFLLCTACLQRALTSVLTLDSFITPVTVSRRSWGKHVHASWKRSGVTSVFSSRFVGPIFNKYGHCHWSLSLCGVIISCVSRVESVCLEQGGRDGSHPTLTCLHIWLAYRGPVLSQCASC